MADDKGIVDVGVELDRRTKTNIDTFYVDVGKDIDSDIVCPPPELPSPLPESPITASSEKKGTGSPKFGQPNATNKLESPKEVLIGGTGKKSGGGSTASSLSSGGLSQIPVPKPLSSASSASSLKSKVSDTVSPKETGSRVISSPPSLRDRSNSLVSPSESVLDTQLKSPVKKISDDIKIEKSRSLQKLEKPSLPLPLTPTVSPTKLYANEKSKEVSPLSSDPNYDKLKSPDDLFLVQCHEIQSKVSPLFATHTDVPKTPEKRPATPEYSVPSKLQNVQSIPTSPKPKKHLFGISPNIGSSSAQKKNQSELQNLPSRISGEMAGSQWTPLRMVQEPRSAFHRREMSSVHVHSESVTDHGLVAEKDNSQSPALARLLDSSVSSHTSQQVVLEEKMKLSATAEMVEVKPSKEESSGEEPLLKSAETRKRPQSVAKKQKGTPSAGSIEGGCVLDKKLEDTSSDAWLMTLTAVYGKLLVIIGLALPLTEVISDDIPTSFFEGFFLYLYYVSILFLAFVYITSCRKSDCGSKMMKNIHKKKQKEKELVAEDGNAAAAETASVSTYTSATIDPILANSSGRCLNYGSLYLRIATVAFGIGSMVYTGLECSQFFELDPDSKCYSVLQLAGPLTRLLFVFLQTYFVFMNSKLISTRCKAAFCFGLVHMIATNICIWISVIITEAKIEVDSFQGIPLDGGNFTDPFFTRREPEENSFTSEPTPSRRIEPMSLVCHRTGIMGKFLNKYSPFLSPCVIAYSLISSGILFVIWRRTLKKPYDRSSLLQIRSTEQKLSLDGSHSNRGLFLGVILFVCATLSLILYFILVEQSALRSHAVIALNFFEIVMYFVTFFAALLGIYEMRELKFKDIKRRLKLDNALLIISQTGVLIYCIFTITASYFSVNSSYLMLCASLINLAQTCAQTLFILNAMRRFATNTDQVKRKPGRQVVTFLFVSNFAMWALNAFEKSRAAAHPVQLEFFGVWSWAVVTQVALPLAIFYRFHSTVCLFEVWKNCYKLKPEQL